MASIDDATPNEWDNAGAWGRTVKREQEMRNDYLSKHCTTDSAWQAARDLPDMCEMQETLHEESKVKFDESEPLFTPEEWDAVVSAPTAEQEYAQKRKDTPVFSGVLMYFPLAIAEVARTSKAGNDQHNPNKPLHWDRSKSGDELDALTRHLMEAGTIDTDGIRHSAKVAWRALANLQKELENAAKGA